MVVGLPRAEIMWELDAHVKNACATNLGMKASFKFLSGEDNVEGPAIAKGENWQ